MSFRGDAASVPMDWKSVMMTPVWYRMLESISARPRAVASGLERRGGG